LMKRFPRRPLTLYVLSISFIWAPLLNPLYAGPCVWHVRPTQRWRAFASPRYPSVAYVHELSGREFHVPGGSAWNKNHFVVKAFLSKTYTYEIVNWHQNELETLEKEFP
jgi:hypothetical protein